MSIEQHKQRLIENVPLEMQVIMRWVLWKLESTDGKTTKVPYRVNRPMKPASTTDESTWGTFEDALRAMEQADGIGFVFNGDGLVGIDLDKCFDPATGEIGAVAKTILDLAQGIGAYIEYSPSKTGFHIITKANFSGKGKKKNDFEVYATKRFFTVTGDIYD